MNKVTKFDCIRMITAIADYYTLIDDARKYAYTRAVGVLKDIPENKFTENYSFSSHFGIGNSIESKIQAYISTGTYPDNVSNILNDYSVLKKSLSKNPHKHYMSREDAWNIVYDSGIISKLNCMKPEKCYEFTGSYRRGNPIVGDMDMVIFDFSIEQIDEFIEYLADNPNIRLDAKGYKKLKLVFVDEVKEGDTPAEYLEMDIRFCNSAEAGTMLLYYTGPAQFNVGLRAFAKSKGYKLSEYGILDLEDNKMYTFKGEPEVFLFLGKKYVAPADR